MADKYYVYTRDNCPYCEKMKEYLDENKIAYEERNVLDSGVLNFMINEGYKTVPQVFRHNGLYRFDMEPLGGYTETVAYLEEKKNESL